MFKRIYNIAVRECQLMWSSTIYRFCILVFPLLVVVFFTSLMHEGVPTDMPVGVVDMDRSALSREVVRRLDAMQTSRVVAYYKDVSEARRAIQRGEIYAFLYLPPRTSARLMAGKQPNVSFYYSYTTMAAGSMVYRDMRTVLTLVNAKVGMTKMAAVGMSAQQIKANLQPIALDLHLIGNPFANYNVYLSTYVTPGVLMIFVFLLVPYAIWTEVKFNRSREWIQMAGGNVPIALIGKFLPHTAMFITVFLGFEFYIYGFLDFPHPGGLWPILLVGVLSVLACQGFGIFVSSLMPSLRMSMSVCSLWGVVSFSMCGATWPLMAMHPFLQTLGQFFPLRHYIVIYQDSIFNGFPLIDVWPSIACLLAFVLLPVLSLSRIKRQMLHAKYIP